MLSGTWSTFQAPSNVAVSNMMLLSDGTVMAHGAGLSNSWYQLTPGQPGNVPGVDQSYINGTWTTLSSPAVSREFFPSAILPNGNLYVLGGEYASDNTQYQPQQMSRSADIYNTLTHSWEAGIAPFPFSRFGDDPIEVLSDGRVLAGYWGGPQTEIYDPSTNIWSAGPTKFYLDDRSDEESWVKLPDGSILTYDIFASNTQHIFLAERYVPEPNGPGSWVDASNVDPFNPPALLSESTASELGAAVLLPNGNVFITGNTGVNGNSALYNTSTNTWSAGPTVPSSVGGGDLPQAVLPNGHALLAEYDNTFPAAGTTKIWEYNPFSAPGLEYTLRQPPAPFHDANYPFMLVLPTGQVMMSDESNQFFVFTPSPQAANPAWQATVTSITGNGDGSATLTGTLLNGVSEGAAYGDDAEMASNYPIIRLTAADGVVRYARTYNWSNTNVATGSTPESVQFTMPPGAPDVNYLSVIANGIASDPVLYVTGHFSSNAITLDTDTVLGLPAIRVDVNGSSNAWLDSRQSEVFVTTGVWSSASNDSVVVKNTPNVISTFISGSNVTIGDVTHNLDGIAGPVSVDGATGIPTLTLDDRANAVRVLGQNLLTPLSTTYQVTGSSVTRNDFVQSLNLVTSIPTYSSYSATISYSHLAALVIDGGTTTNTYNVYSTASATPTTINAGSAGDTVNAGGDSNFMDGVNSLNVNGGAGTTLNLNDQANAIARPPGHFPLSTTYLVNNNSITRTDVVLEGGPVSTYIALIGYHNLAALVINGGNTPNIYNVYSTASATPTTINAGFTADVINAGGDSNFMDGVNSLNVNGGAGTTLNLNDQANAIARPPGHFPLSTTYLVNNNSVTRTDVVLEGGPVSTYIALIGYHNLAALAISGGATPNSYIVRSTATGTTTAINTGNSSDNVSVGNSANSLADIQGPLNLDGQLDVNSLVFNDQGATGQIVYTLTSNSLSRTGAALITFQNFSVQLNRAPAFVAGRSLFYNQSAFDGNSAAINSSDDGAIATDKTAYLPFVNGLATFANVSSFSRGINGIMIDLAGSGDHASIAGNDFIFKIGNNNAPGNWATLTAAPTISVRAGQGISGSDRVEVTWAANAIKNTWLEVQVLATANTGLTATDVFFWGNKIGDTGQGTPATTFVTSAVDKTSVLGLLGGGVGITSIRDFNRDNNVTAVDATVALGSVGSIVRLNVAAGGSLAPEGTEQRAGIAYMSAAGPLSAPADCQTSAASAPVQLPKELNVAATIGYKSQLALFEQWGRPRPDGRMAYHTIDLDLPVQDVGDELISLLVAGRRFGVRQR